MLRFFALSEIKIKATWPEIPCLAKITDRKKKEIISSGYASFLLHSTVCNKKPTALFLFCLK
jgi:hypothetical protein